MAAAILNRKLLMDRWVTFKMDREMERRHLIEADRHIAAGARLISEQTARIALSQTNGWDTDESERLLRLFQDTQDQFIAHRQLIQDRLND